MRLVHHMVNDVYAREVMATNAKDQEISSWETAEFADKNERKRKMDKDERKTVRRKRVWKCFLRKEGQRLIGGGLEMQPCTKV